MSFFVKSSEYFLPTGGNINVDEEIAKLEAELIRVKSFLETVENKLNNERFVSSAPEKVVTIEKQKKIDAEEKIKVLGESIESLRSLKV